MSELIVLKDYRKYLEDNNIELTDLDKATLIYHHSTASYSEKKEMYEELISQTYDEELKKEIKYEIDSNENYLEKFKENQSGSYYRLYVKYKNKFQEEGTYLKYKYAYQDGIASKVIFRIEKAEFDGINYTKDNLDEVYGCVEYYEKGEVKKICSFYKKNYREVRKISFAYRYLNLPYFFRIGDIVHIVGTEKYGIVMAPIDDNDEKQYIKIAKIGEYCDWQIPVNLIYDGHTYLTIFNLEHIQPCNLEYVHLDENDTRKGFLEYMKRVTYKDTIFGPIRNKGRILEILNYLERVWKQYPDMRLGQLLVVMCGKKDLFSIEDEELLERLQCNKWSHY